MLWFVKCYGFDIGECFLFFGAAIIVDGSDWLWVLVLGFPMLFAQCTHMHLYAIQHHHVKEERIVRGKFS